MFEYVVIACPADTTPIGDATPASDDVAAILPEKESCDDPDTDPERRQASGCSGKEDRGPIFARDRYCGRYPTGFE